MATVTTEQAERFAEAAGIPGQRDLDGREVEQLAPEEIVLEGTQGTLDVGGKAPLTVTLTFGGKALVEGGFKKGEELRGTFVARVTGVAVSDTLDKTTKLVVDAKAAYRATIVDVELEPAE